MTTYYNVICRLPPIGEMRITREKAMPKKAIDRKAIDKRAIDKKAIDKKAPSKQVKAQFEKTRRAAHKRVVQRGTIQFRLDPDTMETLLQLSYKLKTPAGVLVRMWTVEHLNQELGNKPSLESRLLRVENILEHLPQSYLK